MKYLKLIGIGFLALQLTACAAFQEKIENVATTISQVVTPDNFDTVTAAYGSTLAVAVSYRRLCQRKVINKSCWNVIAEFQPYEQKTYDAYIVLKDFVKSNPTVDASSFIAALRTAINNFKSIQEKNGVN